MVKDLLEACSHAVRERTCFCDMSMNSFVDKIICSLPDLGNITGAKSKAKCSFLWQAVVICLNCIAVSITEEADKVHTCLGPIH